MNGRNVLVFLKLIILQLVVHVLGITVYTLSTTVLFWSVSAMNSKVTGSFLISIGLTVYIILNNVFFTQIFLFFGLFCTSLRFFLLIATLRARRVKDDVSDSVFIVIKIALTVINLLLEGSQLSLHSGHGGLVAASTLEWSPITSSVLHGWHRRNGSCHTLHLVIALTLRVQAMNAGVMTTVRSSDARGKTTLRRDLFQVPCGSRSFQTNQHVRCFYSLHDFDFSLTNLQQLKVELGRLVDRDLIV